VRYDTLFYEKETLSAIPTYKVDTVERLRKAIDMYKPVLVVLKILEPYNKFYAVLETGKLVRIVSDLLPRDKIIDIEVYLTAKRYIGLGSVYTRTAGVPVEERLYMTSEDILLDVINRLIEALKR